MKNKSDARVTKGIIFAGCSFTWGQGLYYYSNLSTIKEPPPDCYIPEFVQHSHLKFMESVRSPRLVANHFNTFELVQKPNGGSCDSAIKWWDDALTDKELSNNHNEPYYYNYSDISHVIFQMTFWHRNSFRLHYDNKDYDIAYTETWQEPHQAIFEKWLIEHNLTFEEWERAGIQITVDKVKQFLQKMEDHGIKATILTWPEENVKFIKKDPWLNERFMSIDYRGITYNSMQDLLTCNNELRIDTDYENFDIPPKDHHPSLECHQVMARNLIQHLEENI